MKFFKDPNEIIKPILEKNGSDFLRLVDQVIIMLGSKYQQYN